MWVNDESENTPEPDEIPGLELMIPVADTFVRGWDLESPRFPPCGGSPTGG